MILSGDIRSEEHNMNILVFGITGMLGSMVYSYLKQNRNYFVYGTYFKDAELGPFIGQGLFYFDASVNVWDQLDIIAQKIKPDYVINCIGIINRYCNTGKRDDVLNAVKVNSVFPAFLSKYFEKQGKAKIIQIATDCVYDGKRGEYTESDPHNPEDVYGKTKSLGEISAVNFLNLRCSIVGPEINNYNSLFEWFISQKSNSEINGYDHHTWNGVTTLQFAQYCEEIIENNLFIELRNINTVLHFTPNNSVTKYTLLNIFNNVFGKKCVIHKIDNTGRPIKRVLQSEYLKFPEKKPMLEAIFELKKYLENNDVFNTERYIK